MSDFLISFDPSAPVESTVRMLSDRPGMGDRTVDTYAWSWGHIACQRPSIRGMAPVKSGEWVYFVVGRPHWVGATVGEGDDWLTRRIVDAAPDGDLGKIFDRIGGVFVVGAAGPNGVVLMTDPMGSRAVYRGEARDGQIVSMGTYSDGVAWLADRIEDVDQVSLAELLIFHHVSFPYTTRHGVMELPPASVNMITVGGDRPRMESKILWEPTEPDSFPRETEITEQTVEALRQAGRDIVQGADQVAVTLSGGRDSRAMLGAMADDACHGAITYVTHENYETDVAVQVANAAGVRHSFARRGSEFYPGLMPRSVKLLGTELRAAAHGFCVIDNGLDREYDLILGGQLSDTYLKDHYMPRTERERFETIPTTQRARAIVRNMLVGVGLKKPRRRHNSFDNACAVLQPSVLEAVMSRREARLAEVARVRPNSAAEWMRFWPTSRQDDTAHVQGNLRLFGGDTFFTHRDLVDTARRIPPALRFNGRLANTAFAAVYGHLGSIVNANTGAPANADETAEKAAGREKWIATRQEQSKETSKSPWDNTSGSWYNPHAMQQASETWKGIRQTAVQSDAIDILTGVLEDDPRQYLAEYRPNTGPQFNLLATQLVWHMNWATSRVDTVRV